MFTRRTFTALGLAFGGALSAGRLWADTEPEFRVLGELPPLPDDLVAQASNPPAPYVETAPVGTAAPRKDEVDAAAEILFNSPYQAEPIEVANYFLAVGAGAYGAEFQKFAREWPVRANPAIFHFFTSTQTIPEGDTTAWCAAFVNWCHLRAHATSPEQIGKSPGFFSKSGTAFDVEAMKRYSTNSASSGSFRCNAVTKTPRRGDLVVMANRGTSGMTASCKGTGHVAFYLGVPRDGWVRMIGGNQTAPGTGGAVTIAEERTGNGSRFFGYANPKA